MPPESEDRNPPVSKGVKDENTPAVKLKETPQCHIHDKVYRGRVEDIRQNVCVNDLPLIEHTDGKHYCLFHLPTKDKDVTKFEEIFRTRLESVSQKVAAENRKIRKVGKVGKVGR